VVDAAALAGQSVQQLGGAVAEPHLTVPQHKQLVRALSAVCFCEWKQLRKALVARQRLLEEPKPDEGLWKKRFIKKAKECNLMGFLCTGRPGLQKDKSVYTAQEDIDWTALKLALQLALNAYLPAFDLRAAARAWVENMPVRARKEAHRPSAPVLTLVAHPAAHLRSSQGDRESSHGKH
jgi:hypothetical protein